MSLQEYQRKRRFDRTREPSAAMGSAKGRAIFVVQLHHARARHYDFRLQVGDTLKSWAVPKGPSFDPSVKRMAVEVEDHPVSYAEFEGEIPKGEYGGGHVAIFDEGIWTTPFDVDAQLRKGHLRFNLHGGKLQGEWHLIRTAGKARQPQWLLVKEDDAFAEKGLEADDLIETKPRIAKPRKVSWAARALKLPKAVKSKRPQMPIQMQLAKTASHVPAKNEWLIELKWDGYRLIAELNDGVATLWTRNGLDWTYKMPDIATAIESLGVKDAVFDGELIAGQGRWQDFNLLQATLAGEKAGALSFVLFDVLWIDGVDVSNAPLRQRKELLQSVIDKHHPISLGFSAHSQGDAKQALQVASDEGFEGLIAKRADAPYRHGRHADWIKLKSIASDEYAVVGMTQGQGSRTGFGALLLARLSDNGKWEYAGRVGSGFDDAMLREITKRLKNADKSNTPTVELNSKDAALKKAQWFAPQFVVEVNNRGISGIGLLRQPSLKAIRFDKNLNDLMPEIPDVKLTNPQKVLFPEDGITKQQVADYYAAVRPWFYRELKDRPLSLIRCPDGIADSCFFQKHAGAGLTHLHTIADPNGKHESFLVIGKAGDIDELVQFNSIEFHPWGAKAENPTQCDLIVFDLDPDEAVTFANVKKAAVALRKHLATIGLESFVRTSGGKGLHVVVPLNPPNDWPLVKSFAGQMAKWMEQNEPTKYVATASKGKRKGKIFIDYLRNTQGATSVASLSLRARQGAPVAMPLAWDALSKVRSAGAFNIKNVPKLVAAWTKHPWGDINGIKQNLLKLKPSE